MTGVIRCGFVALAVLVACQAANAQVSYQTGQNASPGYEGWELNEDGSFNLVFGYMNRNWQEELDVPVGPDNNISPGPADQGQPTHFLPRRNRYVFKVRVPADFGDQELVWTLTTQGKTEAAYGTLRLDYRLDYMVIMSETGSIGAGFTTEESRANTPPTITLVGNSVRRVSVGQPVTLVARITDDDLPRVGPIRPPRESDSLPTLSAAALRPPGRITVQKVNGLHLSWFLFRGDGEVEFDPPQIKTWEDTRAGANSPWAPLFRRPPVPEDGEWTVRVTFDRPGTYVLRGRADDGGLLDDTDVTIIVSPVL
ncbi:MAG: hypothetical protein IIB37_04615 [Gemmatimonadetes bacterium]|nr:hypothetical protein [Gemmatimonadota bacterium]MCH8812744.1 hypothetical protein [Gemmatimonadota bacterium]